MCKTSFDAGARHGEKAAHREIEKLRIALKVIYTWASFDKERGVITNQNALDGKHVMEICEKALNPCLTVPCVCGKVKER